MKLRLSSEAQAIQFHKLHIWDYFSAIILGSFIFLMINYLTALGNNAKLLSFLIDFLIHNITCGMVFC